MDTETWHREAQYLAQRSRDEQVAGPGVESRQFGFRIFETRQHRPPGSFRVSVGPGNPAALPGTGFCFWLGPGLPWGQRWGGLWTLCSSQILRPSHSPAQTSAGAPVVPPPDPPSSATGRLAGWQGPSGVFSFPPSSSAQPSLPPAPASSPVQAQPLAGTHSLSHHSAPPLAGSSLLPSSMWPSAYLLLFCPVLPPSLAD